MFIWIATLFQPNSPAFALTWLIITLPAVFPIILKLLGSQRTG